MAFVEDNRLSTSGGIRYHDELPTEDEDMSPTLENLVVLIWLKLMHPELPHLVKQRYGTELRSRTLASIKPEVSQTLDSLLEELHHTEEAQVMRFASQFPNQPYMQFQKPQSFQCNTPCHSSKGTCPICKQAGRKVFDHF